MESLPTVGRMLGSQCNPQPCSMETDMNYRNYSQLLFLLEARRSKVFAVQLVWPAARPKPKTRSDKAKKKDEEPGRERLKRELIEQREAQHLQSIKRS